MPPCRRPARWPDVTAVVPARDEAACIADSVGSLLAQDYPGRLRVILVDDGSTDGTAGLAEQAAAAAGAADRLEVIAGAPLPQGWTGKLWAMKQGIDRASAGTEAPPFLLLTDADIVHDPRSVARLVARAEAGGLVLASLMVRLRCSSFAERCIVPAFVYFFRMLYPFAWVNRTDRTTAAAAGGCMLVRREALARAGGVEAIRGELIDDCALGRRLKAVGPIWLGLSDSVRSVRAYDGFGPLRRMVVRSAYAELRYSPLRLAGAVAGMAVTFLAPPLLALFGGGVASLAGLAACVMMMLSFVPILRFYGLSALWAPALPLIALVYTAWTVESAVEHASGRGGRWKGRAQAMPRGAR